MFMWSGNNPKPNFGCFRFSWRTTIAYKHGFAAVEIRKVEQLVREHEELILRKWYEHFGKPTRERPSRNGR
jgi:hypothetical protein